MNKLFEPYWYRKDEFIEKFSYLIWDKQSCCSFLTKRKRAYSCVWWPGNDKEIETSVKTRNHHTSPEKGSNTPMGKYHITRGKNSYWSCWYAFLERCFWLVYTLSKWIEATPMGNIKSASVIIRLRERFAVYGILFFIVRNNGSSFSSQECNNFCIWQNLRTIHFLMDVLNELLKTINYQNFENHLW